MARTKVTPRKGERGGETRMLRMRMVVVNGGKGRRPPSPVHPPSLARKAFSYGRGDIAKDRRGRAVGGGEEVTIIITHLTVGPDGFGGQAI